VSVCVCAWQVAIIFLFDVNHFSKVPAVHTFSRTTCLFFPLPLPLSHSLSLFLSSLSLRFGRVFFHTSSSSIWRPNIWRRYFFQNNKKVLKIEFKTLSAYVSVPRAAKVVKTLRCQFHQHFTRAFFVQKFVQSQNVTRNKAFVREIRSFNVDEIDHRKTRIVSGIFLHTKNINKDKDKQKTSFQKMDFYLLLCQSLLSKSYIFLYFIISRIFIFLNTFFCIVRFEWFCTRRQSYKNSCLKKWFNLS